METKFIEATHSIDGTGPLSGGNWGKFCVARFEPEEEARPSAFSPPAGYPLLAHCGWDMSEIRRGIRVWVLDLQTGEGAFLRATPRGMPHADLEKRRVRVCPMFEPFLEWLYQQDLSDLSALPGVVELPDAPFAFSGYRRPGAGAEDTI